MKKYFYLFLIIVGCKSENKEVVKITKKSEIKDSSESKVIQQINDSIWIEDFKKFRECLYTNNYNELVKYVQFPLESETWSYVNNIKYGFDTFIDNRIPFEEKDFKKNMKVIFDNNFIHSILTIKSAQLSYQEEVISSKPYLKNNIIHKAFLCRNRNDRLIIIGISSESLVEERPIDVPIKKCGLFSEFYRFVILSDGHLKFIGMGLAG